METFYHLIVPPSIHVSTLSSTLVNPQPAGCKGFFVGLLLLPLALWPLMFKTISGDEPHLSFY